MAEWIGCLYREFDPGQRQAEDLLKLMYLNRPTALDKDWFAQCQDNVIELGIV